MIPLSIFLNESGSLLPTSLHKLPSGQYSRMMVRYFSWLKKKNSLAFKILG